MPRFDFSTNDYVIVHFINDSQCAVIFLYQKISHNFFLILRNINYITKDERTISARGGAIIKGAKSNYNVSEKVTINLKTLLEEYSMCDNVAATNTQGYISFPKDQHIKVSSLKEIKSIKEQTEDKEAKRHKNEERFNSEQSTNKDYLFSHVTRVIGNILFYSVLVFCIVTVYFYNNNNTAPRNVFGYSYFTVLTTSMQSVIPQGSLIITKHVDPNQIKIGDDITYLVNYNTTFTHRVIDIYEDYYDTGMRGFQTQGVNNPLPDEEIVIAANIVGVVIFHIAGVGSVLTYIKHNLWILILIFVILLVLIINFNTFQEVKKEDSMRII